MYETCETCGVARNVDISADCKVCIYGMPEDPDRIESLYDYYRVEPGYSNVSPEKIEYFMNLVVCHKYSISKASKFIGIPESPDGRYLKWIIWGRKSIIRIRKEEYELAN